MTLTLSLSQGAQVCTSLRWCQTCWFSLSLCPSRRWSESIYDMYDNIPYGFVSQGLHDDSGIVTAGRPVEVSLRPQPVMWPQMVCPPWTLRCGPGAAALRASWDTEISSPGWVPLTDLDLGQHLQLVFCIKHSHKKCTLAQNRVRACSYRLQPLCIKSLSNEEVIKVAAGSHHSLALTAQCQVTKMFLKKKHLNFFFFTFIII